MRPNDVLADLVEEAGVLEELRPRRRLLVLVLIFILRGGERIVIDRPPPSRSTGPDPSLPILIAPVVHYEEGIHVARRRRHVGQDVGVPPALPPLLPDAGRDEHLGRVHGHPRSLLDRFGGLARAAPGRARPPAFAPPVPAPPALACRDEDHTAGWVAPARGPVAR